MTGLRWITAFIDVPAHALEPATAFWQSVTGSVVSPTRGEHGELTTLIPRDGEPSLKIQRVEDGPAGVHLDLHTDDVPSLVDHATACGADVQQPGEHVVMRSPGGFTFCVVDHPTGGSRPSPVPWWGGSSLVDTACLDMPSPVYEREVAFWAELTGREHVEGRFAEYSSLEPPADQFLRLLLQRLESDDGPVRAHLDLSSVDRVAEVVRHRSIGAELVREAGDWTVLRDPAGLEYCVTDRDPVTGTLPPLS